jgi:hypothetical protein
LYITLRYPTRRRVAALLLFATSDRMRVVVRNQHDTQELRLIGTQWLSDRGSVVEIDTVLTDDPGAVARIWRGTQASLSSAAS